MYGVGHIDTFDKYFTSITASTSSSVTTNAGFGNIKEESKSRAGARTFSAVYRFGYWIGVTDDVVYTRYGGIQRFNNFSILRDLIEDFGVRGSIFFIFFSSLLLNLLFSLLNFLKKRDFIVGVLIISILEWTAIGSLFNYIFFLLVVVLSPFVGMFHFGRPRKAAAARARLVGVE